MFPIHIDNRSSWFRWCLSALYSLFFSFFLVACSFFFVDAVAAMTAIANSDFVFYSTIINWISMNKLFPFIYFHWNSLFLGLQQLNVYHLSVCWFRCYCFFYLVVAMIEYCYYYDDVVDVDDDDDDRNWLTNATLNCTLCGQKGNTDVYIQQGGFRKYILMLLNVYDLIEWNVLFFCFFFVCVSCLLNAQNGFKYFLFTIVSNAFSVWRMLLLLFTSIQFDSMNFCPHQKCLYRCESQNGPILFHGKLTILCDFYFDWNENHFLFFFYSKKKATEPK